MPSRTIALLLTLGWACCGMSGCRGQAGALNERALDQLRQGNPSRAAELLEEASRLAPERYEVFFNLAEAYRLQGRLPAALEAVAAAGRLAPREGKVVAARARLLLLDGRSQEALSDLAGLEEPVRSHFAVEFYYALALVENGRAPEALPLLERFVERRPNVADGHAALGLAYLTLGEFTEGNHQLELALRQDPGLIEAHLYLARHYLMDVQDYRRAQEQLYTARGHAPADPRVYLLLGQTNLALQLLNEADRAFEKAIQLQPEAWAGYLGMAETALRRGNAEQSLSLAKRAEAKAPDEPKVFNFLARLYSQRHQTNLAIQAYQESLKRDPNQPGVREALAKLEQS